MGSEIRQALGPEADKNVRRQQKGTKMKIRWERVNSDFGEVYRSRVPGGWLVFLSETSISDEPYSGFPERPYAALTFYPDAEHEWQG